MGATAVLIGAARGDDTVAGIGSRPIAAVAPHERTTPAGRFTAEPGHNASGEDVVWFDYASQTGYPPLASRIASRAPG